MREQLIKLLNKSVHIHLEADPAEAIADFLLDNGVVVLPCKVGDSIYKIWGGKSVAEFEVGHIDIDFLPQVEFSYRKRDGTGYYHFSKSDEIGKTVFLTRKEAEAALAKEGK